MDNEIQLIKSEIRPDQFEISGINGDTDITKPIAEAVERSSRLFPYVVRHIANNRMEHHLEDNNQYDSTQYMREVRDELKLCIESLQKQRNLRKLQAINMTCNVTRARQPYFVR